MRKKLLPLLLLLFLFSAFPGRALADSYSFSVPREEVHAYWNTDGTLTLDYVMVFQNDPGGAVIDAVDVGIPNDSYDLGSISAEANNWPLNDIQRSPYIEIGVGVGLGNQAIPPGQSGTLHVRVGRVSRMLYPDDNDPNLVSAVFSPSWFDSSFAHGATDLTVVFHLPPGIQPEEPKYHTPGGNWPGTKEPESGYDAENRVYYQWRSSQANPYTQYTFGASFPSRLVPQDSIVRLSVFDRIGIFFNQLGTTLASIMPCVCILGTMVIIVGAGVLGAWSESRRRKQYLPPKISIEGHGIKRGLTAVEAALLMEQPLDKVMTMILFGVVKKGAAGVTSRDPLKLELTQPAPAGLNPYEADFLKAFETENLAARRKALQDVTINLLQSLQEKMKGFSRNETVDYYKGITERAWQQVTAADTPEVKAQALDENLEWTMVDRDFNDRSRDVFGRGPVVVPIWWGRYDPHFGGAPAAPSHTFGPASGTTLSMPHLPGADFAASVVGGVQSFSSNVIGDLTGFTGKVTEKTNPPPVTSGSYGGRSGGGGHSCACACACAGCACACAGGGR